MIIPWPAHLRLGNQIIHPDTAKYFGWRQDTARNILVMWTKEWEVPCP